MPRCRTSRMGGWQSTVGPFQLDSAGTSLMNLICIVCGPFGLAEGVRSALGARQISNVMTGQPSIVLHVETFGMVSVLVYLNITFVDVLFPAVNRINLVSVT